MLEQSHNENSQKKGSATIHKVRVTARLAGGRCTSRHLGDGPVRTLNNKIFTRTVLQLEN